MAYDPRGFKAHGIKCRRVFYIPWETMNDAGYCDKCVAEMREKEKREGRS
jgi:hypothetical protein